MSCFVAAATKHHQLAIICTSRCNNTKPNRVIHTHYSHQDLSDMYVCWPLPSNQSFYRQTAGYQRGVGDHRIDYDERWSWANMHLMHPN